ncbi:DinB family protein [Streptomyces sp. H27-D2]|uniref:DinB family protein n=1 Tax=Streptomyces sp. H27-D2 TaxID=3046304 RepID=UPI002DB8B921|nr:DinB family protein [Streptomyces sp. H27-D2]MEC4018213.1 DinB family protein [Streptomyces sp. H27-D2]
MPTLVNAEAHGDERGALLAYLEAQRGAIRRSLLGLTDEQAALRPTAGELTLSGLLKHLTEVEQNWIVAILAGRPEGDIKRDESNWGDSFRLVDDETVAGMLARNAQVARETEEYINSLPDLDGTVPLPVAPWFPQDGRRSARWVLLTLIQELARHAGHADIIREAIDGKTAFELVDEDRAAQAG